MSEQPPQGYRYIWKREPVDEWRVVDELEGHERRCRYGAGGGRRSCGKPSVAALARTHHRDGGRYPVWWHYCEQHLYGRRLDEARRFVLTRRLVDEDAA